MTVTSHDGKNICPICKKGTLSKQQSSSFLNLIKRIYVECHFCGAAFLKIDEKYLLEEIKDTSYPNWNRYNHQLLTSREWNAIAHGGYSDQEQKQIDIETWLQQVASGAVILNNPYHSNIVLNSNERVVYSIPEVVFSEPRSVRETSGVYGGPSIRITKGLNWRIGGFKAKSESHEELRNIDTGTLTITNKRLIFTGSLRNNIIDLKKITSLEPYEDGISINKEGKDRPVYFTNTNRQKITASNQGQQYNIPVDGLILKILIEKEIS